MLFVLSKEKIVSYAIAISTVVVLIGMAMLKTPSKESLETVSEIRVVNEINNINQYGE